MKTSNRTREKLTVLLAGPALFWAAGCTSIVQDTEFHGAGATGSEPPVIYVDQPAPPVVVTGPETTGEAPPSMSADERAAALAGGLAETAPDSLVYIESESDFYEPLEPYGCWVSVYPYGRCWYPRGVPYGWRPYSRGSWAWCDAGWYWRSPEPWGWATYHYGRWTHDSTYGWVWVPLTTWAPSWVCWRQCDDFIGWAPMPPYGVDYYGGSYYWPDYYCYVPTRRFTHPVEPEDTVVAQAPPAAQPKPTSSAPPSKSRIEQATDRAIKRLETHALRLETEAALAAKYPRLAARIAEIEHNVIEAVQNAKERRNTDRDIVAAPTLMRLYPRGPVAGTRGIQAPAQSDIAAQRPAVTRPPALAVSGTGTDMKRQFSQPQPSPLARAVESRHRSDPSPARAAVAEVRNARVETAVDSGQRRTPIRDAISTVREQRASQSRAAADGDSGSRWQQRRGTR